MFDKLIDFLIRDKHDSTLRHCTMTFEVYAPLMVARQWYKHAVSSTHLDDQMGWNESSRRYITENEENGFVSRIIPALTSSDYYHYHNKWIGNKRAAILHIHDANNGLIGEFTYSV